MTVPPAISEALPLLLIEDERSVSDFIRMALERNGYACRTANSAAEGTLDLWALFLVTRSREWKYSTP